MSNSPKNQSYGPFLHFKTIRESKSQHLWTGSILYITNSNQSPVLLLLDTHKKDEKMIISDRANKDPLLLDSQHGYYFWLYSLEFELISSEKTIYYKLDVNISTQEIKELDLNDWLRFQLPSIHHSARWLFYSCHNEGQDVWQDVKSKHSKQTYHYMIGVGDQIYNDEVFNVQNVLQWFQKIREKSFGPEDQQPAANDEETQRQIDFYFFNHYVEHFSQKPFGELLSCIPQIMLWDDHDTFDGYGSYPAYIQNANMIQMIFKASQKYYLLFQQHTSLNMNEPHFTTNGKSFSFLSVLDKRVSLLAFDIRSQRTLDQCIHPETWDLITKELNTRVPETCQHLIMVQTIPILWPSMSLAEKTLSFIGKLNHGFKYGRHLLSENKAYQTFMYPFDEQPQLLDDLIDQWMSPHHLKERKKVIEYFQSFAQNRFIRISIISGDPHCAGAGRFYSQSQSYIQRHSKLQKEVDRYWFDARCMLSLVSSPASSPTAPNTIIDMLNVSSKFINHDNLLINPETRGEFFQLLPNKKFVSLKNWVEMNSIESQLGQENALLLEFKYHFVPSENSDLTSTIYAPPLLPLSVKKDIKKNTFFSTEGKCFPFF